MSNGKATLTKSFTTVGTYTITAVYNVVTNVTATCAQAVTLKSAEIVAPVVEKPKLLVYPNPFSDKLRFEFMAPADMHTRINLYDVTGRMVQMVFDNEVKGGVEYNAEFTPSTKVSGIYIYRMTMGEEVFNGKVMYKQ